MLQVERSPFTTMNASRIYRAPPKPIDFLTRNKRALHKNKTLATTVTAKHETKSKKAAPTARSKAQHSQAPPIKSSEDVNTVMISKSYLDGLLRMTMTGVGQSKQSAVESNTVRHVKLDTHQVPGLSEATPPNTIAQYSDGQIDRFVGVRGQQHDHAPSHSGVIGQQHVHGHTTSNQPLSKHEQWMRDLAQQVEDKKMREKKQKEEMSGIFFPFGRPGGGAPIRDESGGVVADLRSKVRTSYDGPSLVEQSPRRINQHQRKASPEVPHVAEAYFPFGRPGGGAPIRDETGDVVSDLRSKVRTSYDGPSMVEQSPRRINQHQRKASPEVPHVAEAYFPFGRPGGGAPIRDETGGVVADLRSKVEPHSVKSKPKSKGTPHHKTQHPAPKLTVDYTHQEGVDLSPRFGRGEGPLVDKFVLHEREQKRRKEMEHRAYLAEQIASKEREKVAVRLAKEEAEAIEEARLAREKETLKHQYQRDMLARQQKEERVKERQRMLQRGIEEATESALRAKQGAKGVHTTHSTLHPTHSTQSPSHTTTRISSKFDSVLRSPSLLHAQGPTSPREIQTEQKVSRIPVRRSSSIRKSTVKRSSNKLRSNQPVQGNQVLSPNRRVQARSPPPVRVRAPSPPVPALARRMNKHNYSDNQQNNTRVDSVPSNIPPHDRAQEEYLPPRSPPVPALAKKVKDPATSQRSAPVKDPPRAVSPPVPSLAKKLRQINVPKQQSSTLPQLHNDTTRNMTTEQPLNSRYTDTLIRINRVPSCELVREGLSPDPTLATSAMATDQRTVIGSSRQQVILQQLAALKQGILSRKSDIDLRVKVIMGRQRPNF